jgi:2-polyprenyl-3-methyl-5-hydroxy-6-metoxy-1,4-benzoquinol methylase
MSYKAQFTYPSSFSNFTDEEIVQCYLSACATYIQWLVDRFSILDGELSVSGWAIPIDSPDESKFFVNGVEFEYINYPLPSPDVGSHFSSIPQANNARFICKTTLDSQCFQDGFIRIEFFSPGDDMCLVRRKAWYIPDPNDGLDIPQDVRIERVIGSSDRISYLIGGASIFKRFEDFLVENFSRVFSEFSNILDWGCGSGRVSRYFCKVAKSRLWGVDIDGDNIEYCTQHYSHGIFSKIPLNPPTEFPNEYFDLVIGISVFTHLKEEIQFEWLEELRRITKPGAILLVSIQGISQAGFYKPPASVFRDVEKNGFVITGKNSQLDKVIDDRNYYVDVIHSRDYIHQHWGLFFEVLDIVDALAANQDLVVMRRR